MKKYHRQSKKWVSEEEYEKLTSKPRDKKLCRGKKPHDYVLVLPRWVVTYNSDYRFDPNLYYEIMDKIYKFEQDHLEKLKKAGIEVRFGRIRNETRYYVCSVCGKQEYDLKLK